MKWLIIVFPVLISSLLKVLECGCCTRAKKVLSSPRCKLMAQGAALWCSEPSVIPFSYPRTYTCLDIVGILACSLCWSLWNECTFVNLLYLLADVHCLKWSIISCNKVLVQSPPYLLAEYLSSRIRRFSHTNHYIPTSTDWLIAKLYLTTTIMDLLYPPQHNLAVYLQRITYCKEI